jgi:hypothetical protein
MWLEVVQRPRVMRVRGAGQAVGQVELALLVRAML